MKIRTQLLGLGLGSQLLIVLAVAAYFVILSPITQFEAETVSIHAAARQALSLQIAANKLALLGIETQRPVFEAAFQLYSGAVDDTGKISRLLTINETMRNAVDSVRRLKEMSTDAIGLVTANLADLRADIKGLGTRAVDLDFATILQTIDEGSYPADQKDTVHYHVNAAVANLKSCDEILTSTVKIIEEKDHIIASEIAAIRTASTFTATGILALVLVSVILFSLLLATAIARSMRVLSRNVAIAATGDLTQRFQLKRNDEIGGLGHDLNNLLVEFNRILGRIQEASRQNELLCEDFVKIVSESSSSAVQIEVNTDAIGAQLVKMDTMVATAEGQAGGIAATLKEFHNRLALQDHHVSETVSAVTKMLEAIENIAVITERDSKSAGHMLEETKRSWAVFDQASQTMSDISESVVLIQEMTSVISGLSGQTNILAINAAIEAAHAGEYGKSFAVVADEIGTLATAAAVSSQEIAANVATVVVKMNAARSAQTATSDAFVRISTDIAEVTRSISEIHDNISGLQSGSRQVLGSMEILGATSSEVTEKAGFIDTTALSLKEAMSDLTGISHEVTTNIGEIASGIQLITGSIREVSERTSRLEGIGDELNSAVLVFKTAES